VCVLLYKLLYMFLSILSSSYLCVFDDDRVRGTREQMMLQVVLVERKAGAWASWETLWHHFII